LADKAIRVFGQQRRCHAADLTSRALNIRRKSRRAIPLSRLADNPHSGRQVDLGKESISGDSGRSGPPGVHSLRRWRGRARRAGRGGHRWARSSRPQARRRRL